MKIAQETRDICAPIANRLGMSKIKNELEELAFNASSKPTRRSVSASKAATRRGLIEELKKTVSAKLAEAQVPILHIDGRIKRLFSIHQKLKRQKIVSTRSTTSWRCGSSPTRSRTATRRSASFTRRGRRCPPHQDFIAMPRPNGYRSLHTSVVSERVSLRCRSGPRKCTASPEGIAAHWK